MNTPLLPFSGLLLSDVLADAFTGLLKRGFGRWDVAQIVEQHEVMDSAVVAHGADRLSCFR